MKKKDMKKGILAIIILLSLQSCNCLYWTNQKSCKKQIPITKKVVFETEETDNFVYPEFVNKLKRKHSISFLIRKAEFDTNNLTSNSKLQSTDLYWELEKALILDQHTVIDPSLYHKWKSTNKERSPKFDYILEIMEAYSTQHSTGINNRYLLGSKLIIKIINPITHQTVGILNSISTPCTSGCEFTYTDCKIIEEKVLKTKYSKPQNFLSKGFSNSKISNLVQQMRELSK